MQIAVAAAVLLTVTVNRNGPSITSLLPCPLYMVFRGRINSNFRHRAFNYVQFMGLYYPIVLLLKVRIPFAALLLVGHSDEAGPEDPEVVLNTCIHYITTSNRTAD